MGDMQAAFCVMVQSAHRWCVLLSRHFIPVI